MMEIRLDHKGMAEMLKSAEVGTAISSLAGEIVAVTESLAASHSGAVVVEAEHYETDRAASAVIVKHPGALGMEAKHGILSKAASSVGLQVKKKG